MSKVGSFVFEGVRFDFTVGDYDEHHRELCVTIRGYADLDLTVVAAFDRGGLTLCGDYVHLALDGDEMLVDDGREYRRDLERDLRDREHEQEWLHAQHFQL